MFGDIFATQDDLLSKDQNPTAFNTFKPKNCAAALDLPPLKRDKCKLVGLRNQGATCYLNSLIQALYMIPEFRAEFLKLPLCQGDLENPTNFVEGSKKHNLLLAFQKLFAEMKALDLRSVSTEEMTKSFGWENNEQLYQQDIQEAFRVLFDSFERALFGTEMHDCISKNFQGVLVNHITCLNCGIVKEKPDFFYDLNLQVQNLPNLEESLMNFITPERLEGSNQYFCESCNMKVDALKGVKIRTFPKILVFSLNRFLFDFEKMERVKINDNFVFGLEFNSLAFQEIPNENDLDNEYELCSVILHRGNAYGGHYHGYIRDVINEGNWEELMKEIELKKQEVQIKNLAEAELQNSKKIEENLNKIEINSSKKHSVDENFCEKNKENNENNEKIEGDGTKNDNDGEKTEQNNEVNHKETEKNGKKGRKKGAQKQKGNNGKNNKKNYESKKKKENNKKEKVEYIRDEFFDDLEFPIPFKNGNLAKNWFDFNDSCVTAISVNRIQKQFGGSNENAYILIYRKKNIEQKPNETSFIPPYLVKNIQMQNEIFENERKNYADAEKHIEIFVINSHDINFANLEFKTETKEWNKLKLNIEEKFEKALSHLAYEKMCDCQNFVLVEVYELGNKLLQFKKILSYEQKEFNIQSLDIQHSAIYLFVRVEEVEEFSYVHNHLGGEPIKINLFFGSKKMTIIDYLDSNLNDFKCKVSQIFELGESPFYLRIMQESASVLLNVNQENDKKSLKSLNFQNFSDVFVSKDEILDEMKEENDNNTNELNEDSIFKSILVERDDEDGFVKLYVNLNWTLMELFTYIKETLRIDEKIPRRIRKLKGGVLFYEEDLLKNLRDLEFEEGGIRLRIERGPWPTFGNFPLKVIIQSKYLSKEKESVKNIVSSPLQTIQEMIKEICEPLGLDPHKHKLYKTDWLEEPIEVITKLDKPIHMNSIKSNDILVLRDQDNLIPKETMKFCIHLTLTGNPNDSEYLDTIQIKEEENLIYLKKKILSMPQMKAFSEMNLRRLRVREIKKDLFFGRILRNEEKPLKKLNIKSYSLVCQVLNEEEHLQEDDLVLMFRKRNVQSRTYENYVEKIFSAPKEPKINDLKSFVLNAFGIKDSEDAIELAKYVSHDFNWLQLHLKYFEELQKKKKTGKKKKKTGKAKGNNNNKEKPKQIENLRKSPYLLNDGDIIGYRLESENISKEDDFQTPEDEELKMKFMELKQKTQVSHNSKRNDGVGFQILLDF